MCQRSATVRDRLCTWLVCLRLLRRRFHVTLEQSGLSPTLCSPGYTCNNNSLSLVANACPAGRYSGAGASSCANCTTRYYYPSGG